LPKDRSPRRRPERTTSSRNSQPRRRLLPLVVAVISLVLVGAGTYAALRMPWITVQSVRVSGADSLDQAAIAEISGLKGQSMLRLSLSKAKADLLEIPQIKSVSFERHWPRQVTIKVQERRPWGFWSVGGRDYPIDAEGVVLAAGAPSAAAARIVEPDSSRVMGAGDRVDPDAIALADRIFRESPKVLGRSVRELEYSPGVGVTALFDGGLRVTFGDERAYDYKMAVLSKLLDQLRARGVTPSAIDLRFGERVTYE
jgi:cell division protein FtsQ